MAELELRHLRALCAIADEGSLSRAAVRLGVTQPALTVQLRSIERTLGGPLFVRSPQGATATDLGRSVLRWARVVLEDMSALMSAARTHVAATEDAPLVLACMPTLFTGQLIAELPRWVSCSRLRTEVDSSAPALLDMVLAKRADLAVFERFDAMATRHLPDVEVRTIVTEPQFVAVADTDPLAADEVIDLADLADHDWVFPPPDQDPLRQSFRQACADAGFSPRVTHHVTEARTALSLVAGGATCLVQPAAVDGPGYVTRPLKDSVLSVPIVAVVPLDGVLASRREDAFAAIAHAYHQTVDRNPAYAAWWAEHPEAHTAVDAALALPRPTSPA